MTSSHRFILAMLLMLSCALGSAAQTTVTYLHTDHLGSPILARSEAGTTLWRDDYGPWGEQLLAPAGNQGDVGYTGHYTESGLGLTYAQARWYDQVAGVFLSPDPVLFAAQRPRYFMRYAYVHQNPVRHVDPDGREVVSLDWRNNVRLAGAINKYSKMQYAFDGNNMLHATGRENKSGSEYYSNRVDAAISAGDAIYVEYGESIRDENGNNISVSKRGGAATFAGGGVSPHVVISSSGSFSAKAGGEEAFAVAHELVGHAIPNLVGSDTGYADKNTNKVLKQIGVKRSKVNKRDRE